jgi:outer membrane protein TolC
MRRKVTRSRGGAEVTYGTHATDLPDVPHLHGSAAPREIRPAMGVVWVMGAVLTLAASTAFAQSPIIPRVDLDEAVRRALAKNPSVAQAATAILRAEALLDQTRSGVRPTVSAGATNVTIDHQRGFAGGVTQPQDQLTLSADVSMPILAPSRWASLNQGRDQIDVATRSAAEVRRQIAVAAAQAYLAVIAGQRQIDVDLRALDAALAHLDYAEKRLEGGAGSRLNQLRAAQVVSSEESQIENGRLALLRAQEALGVLLAENGPVDAASEPAFDVPTTVAEAEWLAARPDVKFQEATIDAAKRVVRDSARDWLPTGTATFTPQYVTPAGLFQPSKTWRLVLSFTQPLYEGGQRKAVMRLRDVSLNQAKLALDATEIQARSEVRLAQASLSSRERALATARLASTQAGEVLQITIAAFEVGATTNIEVIDAQRSARDADTTATIAEDAVRRAKLDLLVALGRFPK